MKFVFQCCLFLLCLSSFQTAEAQVFTLPGSTEPVVTGVGEECEPQPAEFPEYELGGGSFEYTMCCTEEGSCRVSSCEDSPEWGSPACVNPEPAPSPSGGEDGPAVEGSEHVSIKPEHGARAGHDRGQILHAVEAVHDRLEMADVLLIERTMAA